MVILTVKIVIDPCRRPEAGTIAKAGKKRTCKFSNKKLQFEPASWRVLKKNGEGEGRGEGVSPTTHTQIKVLSGPLPSPLGSLYLPSPKFVGCDLTSRWTYTHECVFVSVMAAFCAAHSCTCIHKGLENPKRNDEVYLIYMYVLPGFYGLASFVQVT